MEVIQQQTVEAQLTSVTVEEKEERVRELEQAEMILVGGGCANFSFL